MARAKKEAVLNPEERLQAALVPDWEWPYKLSENWCWTTIGVINRYIGSSIDPMKSKSNLFELYSVPSSADNFPEIVPGAEIGSTKQSVEKGDVLLCKINPRINRVWKVAKHTENALIASSEWIVVRNSNLLSDYLMWCFRSQYFREYMLSNVSGVGGSLMRAQPKHVQGYPIPLPPLPEQQRIVDRIDSLFATLDEAKAKVQEVVDSYEARKAAILHKAFTGELTGKWRKEHGVEIESWESTSLGEVCNSIFDGDHMPPPKVESGIPFLVISDVNDGHLSFNQTRFVSEDYYANLSDTRKPSIGDVLYTIVGSYGIPVVVDDGRPFCFQRHMALLKPKSVDTYFLWYLLQSYDMYCKATSIATGTAQMTVPIKGLREIRFLRPSLDEQKIISEILSKLIEKEQQVHETALATLNQIDIIKKSILARAFRGELGTNDPNDEPAVELLKKVLDLPAEPKPKAKRKFIPKELDAQIKTDLERKIIKKYIQNETDCLTMNQLMGVSSKRFDIMETLRNLQNRGILIKENDIYKLMG